MLEHEQINANEGGLSVRNKINKMFSDLMVGREGVNNVWENLIELTNELQSLTLKSDDVYYELKEQLLKCFDYTDASVNDFINYVNSISGGIAGFAKDTSYDPKVPEDTAATVLAAGPGTYTHFLNESGAPITIEEEDALTIFYKAAGSTYWEYKSIYARVVVNEKAVINVHYTYKIQQYITLEEAIACVPEKDRIPGQIITFLDELGQWRIFQYRDLDTNHYEDPLRWADLSLGENNTYIRVSPTELYFTKFETKQFRVATYPANLYYTIELMDLNQ